MSGVLLQQICAVFGALGIAAAAYGSHGLEKIAGPDQIRWWAIAAAIQLVTVPVALLVVAFPDKFRPLAAVLLLAGIVVFSGSLYAMALGAPRFLGAITPLGGLLLMAGWFLVAFAPSTLR